MTAPLYGDAFLGRLEEGVRRALPRWGLGEGAQLSLLTVSENATFRVRDPAAGLDMALRVYRPGYSTRADIDSELAWIEALRAGGVIDTPRPIPLAGGGLVAEIEDGEERRQLAAFEFLAGQEPDASRALAPWFGELGAIHARLHGHARQWRRPPGFQRRTWDFRTTLGDAPHWGDWRAGLGLTADGRAVIERAAAAIRRRLDRYGQGPDRFGLVHADLRLANLIVKDDRLAVIDFDDCGFCWFFYDFAAAVSFIEHEPYVAELLEAWLDGYRKVAPVAAEDAAEIETFVVLRRILLTAWVASHAETPTAQAAGPAYTDGTVVLAERFLSRHA